jgi:hypothetical protein
MLEHDGLGIATRVLARLCMSLSRSLIVVLTTLGLAYGCAHGHAQTLASTKPARDLVYALERRGLDAVAVADPTTPGTFVAALYVPRSLRLVISARHPSVEEVARRIASHQYREVFLELQRSPTLQGKCVVQDSGADGIWSAFPNSGEVDVLYEGGAKRTSFDGDIDGQEVTRPGYDAKLRMVVSHYARLLKLLTAAVDGGSSVRESTR